MDPITRRGLLNSTVAGTSAALLQAGQVGERERGTVSEGKVSLPPLHNPSEAEGSVPSPDPSTKRLGVAVVGLGHLALEQIIPGFGEAKHVRLAALVSGEREKAQAIASQYGVPSGSLYDYKSFDRIQENKDVDVVYIVLPNSLHAEYTVRAAKAGKHVLCEKPMATSAVECQAMIEACRTAGRHLMIAYRLQYNQAHRELISMVRQKQFGEVRMITAVNGQNDAPNGQWRQKKALAGGGSLPDVGLYCLSAFRYLTGEEPQEVSGQITEPKNDPRFREIEDICSFTLRFPSGIFASGSSAYSLHENRHLRIMASDAWFGADPAFGYDNIALQIARKAGKANSLEERRFSPKNQFAVEMDDFAQRIRMNIAPLTPGEEGLQDQKIMEAIYRSAQAGGAAIQLPAITKIDSTRGRWMDSAS